MVYLWICCIIHSLQVKFLPAYFMNSYCVFILECWCISRCSVSAVGLFEIFGCCLPFMYVSCSSVLSTAGSLWVFSAQVSFLAVCAAAAVLFCKVISLCSLLQSLLRLFCAFCGPAAVSFWHWFFSWQHVFVFGVELYILDLIL